MERVGVVLKRTIHPEAKISAPVSLMSLSFIKCQLILKRYQHSLQPITPFRSDGREYARPSSVSRR
jgi:hypothetical protein